MIVVPAVDLRGGHAVRLTRGRPEDETVYADDPVAVAERFAGDGARWLHVVDLDAAFGSGSNRDVVRRIVGAVPVAVQVGGGLRSTGDVEAVLAVGAARAVIGTEAAVRPEFLRDLAGRFGERVVAAVDCDDEAVRVRGWTESAGSVDDVVRRLHEAGTPRFLVTAIRRDGTLEGPDVRLYERVRRITDRPVLASGGIRSVEDLHALADTGVEGAVVGKALYEGTLQLSAALEAPS